MIGLTCIWKLVNNFCWSNTRYFSSSLIFPCHRRQPIPRTFHTHHFYNSPQILISPSLPGSLSLPRRSPSCSSLPLFLFHFFPLSPLSPPPPSFSLTFSRTFSTNWLAALPVSKFPIQLIPLETFTSARATEESFPHKGHNQDDATSSRRRPRWATQAPYVEPWPFPLALGTSP